MICLRTLIIPLLLSMTLTVQGCAPDESDANAYEARKYVQAGIYVVPLIATAAISLVGVHYIGEIIDGIQAIEVESGYEGTLPSGSVGPMSMDALGRLDQALNLGDGIATTLGLNDHKGTYDLRRIEAHLKGYGAVVREGYSNRASCRLDVWNQMVHGKCFAPFRTSDIYQSLAITTALLNPLTPESREVLDGVCFCVPSSLRNK